MGILDGIVEWIAEQVMNGLDLISTSVLGALGCDMGTFLRYFPAAETMYKIFVAAAIGRGDQVKPVHHLFGNPFHDAVKYPHGSSPPFRHPFHFPSEKNGVT